MFLVQSNLNNIVKIPLYLLLHIILYLALIYSP